MRGLVIFNPGFLLGNGHVSAGFYKLDHFLPGSIKAKETHNMGRKGIKNIVIGFPVRDFGLHIVKKFIDQLQLQFLWSASELVSSFQKR